jgi:coenzyme F420-reducing hydrogenase beta subunit
METISNVIIGGYCVGCGACSAASNSNIKMHINELGYYSADIETANSQHIDIASVVCPFSNESDNEDVLGQKLFSSNKLFHDPRLGYFLSLNAGRINDSKSLSLFSSGGLTTWIAAELLKAGEIDGVIHVGGDGIQNDGRLFNYVLSESLDQLYARTKSRYYAVEFSKVLEQMRGNGKRYAFIGVPCFVKAVRLLCQQDKTLSHQIAYSLALVCGHMKSSSFAELLAWQVGVEPSELGKIDFRVKDPARPSNQYSISAWDSKSQSTHTSPNNILYGSNWGHAFFQLRACDFCDDVMGETADVSLGDAWLPQYESFWGGTNVIICRNKRIQELLDVGFNSGAILLEPLTADEISASQLGNYRHRWDGLSVRLGDAIKNSKWVPRKRIMPSSRKVCLWRKALVRLREHIALQSHQAFLEAKKRNDLAYFVQSMLPLTNRMHYIYKFAQITNLKFIREKLLNPKFILNKLLKKIKLIVGR